MFLPALIVVVITAIAILLSGLFAWLRNPSSKMNRWYFMFTSLIAVWIVCNYLDSNWISSTSRFLLKIDYILSPFMMWSFLNFSRELYLNYHPAAIVDRQYSKGFLVINILLVPLIFFDVLFTSRVVPGRVEVNYGILFLPFVAILLMQIVLAVRYLILTRKESRGANRSMMNAIYASSIIAILANLLTNLVFPRYIEDGYMLQILSTLGYLGFLVFTFGMYWAITRKKLFDVRVVVARSAAYILSVGILAAVYGLAAFALTVYVFKLTLPANVEWLLALSSALIAISFPSLKKQFDKITTRIFYRDAYSSQKLFDELNGVLVSSLDLKKVLSDSCKIIEKQMKITKVFAYIDYDQRPRLYGSGDEATRELKGALLSLLEAKKDLPSETVVLDDIVAGRKTAFQESLTEQSVAVLTPLSLVLAHHKNSQFGLLVCLAKRSGNSYSDEDISVLETASNEITLAIQNALHYEEIQQFNMTLQEKVEEATHKLRATNDKLKRMDETKDEFISMASHQLRTPLTSVKGYVSMVLDGDVGPISDQQRELLNQSFQSSQRMANLISDLLNLSRINTGKFVIELSPVDLRGVVTAELDQLREMAVDKNIKLTYDPPADFPTLMLDDGKMHQVVMNLIDNALYYTPPGGSVTVTLTETPTAVEFRVIDTGIGVPRDSERHLFTKMYRAENARRARPDGTGLGLFMVKKVVIEQKGAIIFETEEGKGSTFGFKFNKADHLVTEAALKEAAA